MLYFCIGCKLCDDKLCNNEKTHSVEYIQLNSIRFTPEQFGKEKLETLLLSLYRADKSISTCQLDESTLLHDVVTIYYKNGERDLFCFHKIGDIWYMRQADGTVIQNVAFISDYITHIENSGSISVVLNIPDDELLITLATDEALNEKYIFTQKLRNRMELGMEHEKAEKSTRDAMISEYLLYQYALQNGYDVDGMSKKLVKQLSELYEISENFYEVKQVLKMQGISLEKYLEMQERFLAYDAAKQVIYEEKYYMYRHGNTIISGQDCGDFTEYWNTFLLTVVEPEMKGFDLTEYETILDEAATFAWKYLERAEILYSID